MRHEINDKIEWDASELYCIIPNKNMIEGCGVFVIGLTFDGI